MTLETQPRPVLLVVDEDQGQRGTGSCRATVSSHEIRICVSAIPSHFLAVAHEIWQALDCDDDPSSIGYRSSSFKE